MALPATIQQDAATEQSSLEAIFGKYNCTHKDSLVEFNFNDTAYEA